MAATETSTRAAAALDDLYRHHVGDVYRYTYAVLGNHADAEDVTQTTFVNALRALERGDVPHNPSSWLIAIAQNVVRQRWRQAASRPTEVELVQDVPEAASEDDDIELDELVRALQRIPPAQREALVLRELEGRSYNEIAALLGLSTSALETLLFRARRSLAEELENLVTCQSAELAMSKQLDGRLSRKERRRLDEHLAECRDCARLAETQKRQRRAFKGLAVLPLPIGLALFKGAPSAAAAPSLPTIGLGASGSGTSGVGAGSAAGVGATASGAGGAAVGGSLVAVAAKVAAVIVAATVATGVAYKSVEAVLNEPAPSVAARPATIGRSLSAGGASSVAPGQPAETAHGATSGKPESTTGSPSTEGEQGVAAGSQTPDQGVTDGTSSGGDDAAAGSTPPAAGTTPGDGAGSSPAPPEATPTPPKTTPAPPTAGAP